MGCGDSKDNGIDEQLLKGATMSQPPALDNSMPEAIAKNVKDGGFSRDQFILSQTGKITDHYKMNAGNLGEGSFGTVVKAVHKNFKVECAVKVISKEELKNIDRFKQEVQVMRRLDHPNIIHLHETFEDKLNIYLVMEVASGGELFDRIVSVGRFDEVQAAHVIQQVLRAVYYMHESKVVHRDLKPENFLFMSKDPIDQCTLKIIDFGLAIPYEKGQILRTKAGTPFYVSPQVLQGAYDEKCDVWSVGVIMYVLLCGYPPFFGKTDAVVLQKVKKGEFAFAEKDWSKVSDDAKKLIRALLKMKPEQRFSAQRALHDPWVEKHAPNAVKDGKENLTEGMIDNLRQFRSHNKLKKAALSIIATKLNDVALKKLREVFVSIDTRGNGILSRSELKAALIKANIDIPEDMKEILQHIDCDGDGYIDYSEFLAAAMDKRHFMEEKAAAIAFSFFDQDKDGKINRKELARFLADESQKADFDPTKTIPLRDEQHEAVNDLLASVDVDGDGAIDFEEFMQMMRTS